MSDTHTHMAVTVTNPASGQVLTLPIAEAKARLRYGWRYATYDECVARSLALTNRRGN